MLIDYPFNAFIPSAAVPEIVNTPIITDNFLGSKIIHVPNGSQENLPGYFFLGKGRASVVIPGLSNKDELRAHLQLSWSSADLDKKIAAAEAELRALKSFRENVK
jgi:hypothetical protein